MAGQKVYASGISVKERRSQFGQLLSVGVNVEKFVEWLTAQRPNAKGYINLTVSARKEPGKYGETHSVYLDTYQPKKRDEGQTAPNGYGDDESIPF